MTANDLNGDEFDFRRSRRTPDTRQQTPRATRTTKYKKKRGGPGNIGGVHQRRNKHWGW
jgi:hypothetical protein